ncbi:LysR family transcriptional regulator [Brevibacterium jeotgali]|uniref:DNA-binding transcriptional regulator, LysR family n=1 Tax=Brevibacterium jeotgali TaxID=1262550 RepID=A0A2H1L2H0_9MICO|nr:LysR family transcriptional regulator [Brevibacterium jeotgali]TWC03075.1 DNA-binding transcriptional LysR family regulator [Brevibacterium jeotgali]SMY11098.1 DNA-binding transcriptional regulator, LysR family [Brevibacterium jeotgali]
MQWTLAQLRTFSAVAELGTMTAAAGALGYTPGAVSQHMTALQRTVGVRLLAPTGRRVALTEAGIALLPRIRTLLAAEAQAAEAVAGGEPAGRLPVTVGVFGSASVVAIAPAKRLLEKSDVELRAREVDVEQMQDAVSAGRIDVGIGIDYPSSPLAPQRGVRMRVLRTESFRIVRVSAGESARPPAGTSDAASLETAEAAWILPPGDSRFGRAVRFALAERAIAPRETHIVVDTAVTLALVAAGVGLGLATPTMLALAPEPVDSVPGTECGERRIVALTRSELDAQPGVAAAVDAFADVLGDA